MPKDKPTAGAGDELVAGDGTGDALPPVDPANPDKEQTSEGVDAEALHTAALDSMANIADELVLDTGSMVFDVRDFLLDTIKARPKPWSATSQGEQRDVAAACEHAATELVRKVVEAVASRGADPVRVLLTKVTLGSDMIIAGKVKTFDMAEEDRAVETLHKAIGKHVLLTVASADDYKGGEREAETQPDELAFGFDGTGGGEDDENDEAE